MSHRSGGGHHHGGSHHNSSFHQRTYHGGLNHGSSHRHRSRYHSLADSDGDMAMAQNAVSKKAGIARLAVLIPMMLISFLLFFRTLRNSTNIKPEKIEPVKCSHSSHISDYSGFFSDTSELDKALETYKEKTGVCPFIFTIDEEIWSAPFAELKDFAYEVYMDNGYFSDEQHLLVVYSQPAGTKDRGTNWSCDVIQGDRTLGVISEDDFSEFKKKLQEELRDNSNTTEDAFIKAFTRKPGHRTSMKINIGSIFNSMLMIGVWNIVVFILIISTILGMKSKKTGVIEYGNGKKMNVYVLSEDGSQANPYVIGNDFSSPQNAHQNSEMSASPESDFSANEYEKEISEGYDGPEID